MITIEEYLKLREQPIGNYDENFNIRFIGSRIESEFNRRNIKTFGSLFDDISQIIYYRQIGPKGKDIIYNTLFKYLKIEDLMPSEEELKLYVNKHPIDNPKLKIILETIANLEEQRNKLLSAKVENSELYKNLKETGIEFLTKLQASNFEQGKEKQIFISLCVEKYLNNLAETMLNDKKSRFEIERTIQAKMEEYKALVQAKREEIAVKSESGFLHKMAIKIGEVRKYKRPTTTHKEEKEHNPFYNDGQTI